MVNLEYLIIIIMLLAQEFHYSRRNANSFVLLVRRDEIPGDARHHLISSHLYLVPIEMADRAAGRQFSNSKNG